MEIGRKDHRLNASHFIIGPYILLNIRKLGLKETEQRILDDCGCSYGILMQLEDFQNFRRCDYYDEVRCVKHILQDHIFDRNRRAAKNVFRLVKE